MDISEKKLFAQAVAEGLVEKYDAQIAAIDGPVICSKRHDKRMQQILDGQDPTNHRNIKRTIGAILLAAALLLTGCTVYAYRNEIRDFFVMVYDTFIKMTFDTEQQGRKERIEDVYYPTNMLEGYEMTYENVNSLIVIYEYKNTEGDTLMFEQCLLDGANHFLDAEQGNAELREIGDYRFYYKTSDQHHHYIWNDGEYAMTLTSNTALSDEALINLLNGIVPVE